jgi:predicted metalloendopeptidase
MERLSALTIKSPQEGGSYFTNALSMAKWRFEENIAELNKPVDKERWGMSPQTVNAYYNPSNNEIVFPAAILQPPFTNYR